MIASINGTPRMRKVVASFPPEIMARTHKVKPKNIDPVSPITQRAGGKSKIRNPAQVPANKMARIANAV